MFLSFLIGVALGAPICVLMGYFSVKLGIKAARKK